MLRISDMYSNNQSDRIKICKSENMFILELDGVKSTDYYENIFAYGENLFVLVSRGRFGVVQYDENLNEIYSLPCEYQTLDEYWHNLVFSKEDKIIYYNAASKEWIELQDISIDNEFMYGEDKETYMIIEQATGKLIWREYKNRSRLADKPCYIFCGRENGAPMFYDITNADYITKMKEGYARYKKSGMVKPIIINGVNVVSVCERDDKIGTIDVAGKKIIRPQWDEVNIELKVTYKSGKHTKEEVFPVAAIKAGDVIPIEEW